MNLILKFFSSYTADFSKIIISNSVPLVVAYIISTSEISIMKIKGPQRWFLLTFSAILALLPTGLEIYNLVDLSITGDVKYINLCKLASDIFLLCKRLIGWLIVELYFSSFLMMAKKCNDSKKSEDLARNYQELVDTYDSLRSGVSPGLLITFTSNVMNLVCSVYLVTQPGASSGNGSVNNLINILIICSTCYYFCTSCQMCYDAIMKGTQVLRLLNIVHNNCSNF